MSKFLGTDTDVPQIVRVRRKVRANRSRAVAAGIVDARTDIHIIASVRCRSGRSIREPVLHVRVVVAKVVAGEARYGVVYVGHAVFVSSLCRDKLGEGGVAYAWGAKGVDLAGSTVVCSPTMKRPIDLAITLNYSLPTMHFEKKRNCKEAPGHGDWEEGSGGG